MESNMVNTLSNSYNELIIDYFKNNLSDYNLVSVSSHGPYWGVKHSNGEIEINVSGDIGFAIEIFISDSKFDLWQYDRSVNDAMKTNNENVLYQLNILKRFLLEIR